MMIKIFLTFLFITVFLNTLSEAKPKHICNGSPQTATKTPNNNGNNVLPTKPNNNGNNVPPPTKAPNNNGNNVLPTKTPPKNNVPPPTNNNGGYDYVSPINTNMAEKITKQYQENVKCPPTSKNCYIRPLYTPQETGLVKASRGVIDQHLNKPMRGNFTFHHYTEAEKGTSGGECGLGVSYAMHAGVGRALWDTYGKGSLWVEGGVDLWDKADKRQGVWTRSNLKDLKVDHYIRDDAVCINKCVKIECSKSGKTLTIPIMDETDFENHETLDLSYDAFKYLETNENAGLVPATITFMECPQ